MTPFRRPSWKMPLSAYVGPVGLLRTYDAEAIDTSGTNTLAQMTASYRDAPEAFYADAERHAAFAGDPDLVLMLRGSYYAVISLSEKAVVAATTASFPFVRPDFRGRGLTAEAMMIQDEAGERMMSCGYTASGFANRIRTHRLHVQRALDVGHEVPAEVLADYAVESGVVRLRAPYDPVLHESRREEIEKIRGRMRFEDETAHLAEVFWRIGPDGLPEDLASYCHQGDDARLALAVKIRHGGVITDTRSAHSNLFQVRIGDWVVDAVGIRHADQAEADFRRRCSVPDEEPITVHALPTLKAFKVHRKAYPEKTDVFWTYPTEVPVETMRDRVSEGLARLLEKPVREKSADMAEPA